MSFFALSSAKERFDLTKLIFSRSTAESSLLLDLEKQKNYWAIPI